MPSRQRTALVAIAIIACVVAALVTWRLAGNDDATPVPSGSAPSRTPAASPSVGQPTSSTAPTTPSTDEDPAAPTAPQPDPAASVSAGPAAATYGVTLTVVGYSAAADVATVSGYVDVVEQGGACRITLSGPGTTRTIDVIPVLDASTTSCATDVPGTQLSAGTWTASLSYTSPTGTGTGTSTTFEVQR